MDEKEMLNKALDYIMINDDDLYICDFLHDIEEESKYCKDNCDNYCRECVERFLKHWTPI